MILKAVPEMAGGFHWYIFSINPGVRFTPRSDALIWYLIDDVNEYAFIRSSNPVNDVAVSSDDIVTGLRGNRPTNTT